MSLLSLTVPVVPVNTDHQQKMLRTIQRMQAKRAEERDKRRTTQTLEYDPTPRSKRTPESDYHQRAILPGATLPPFPSDEAIKSFIQTYGETEFTPTGVYSTIRILSRKTSFSSKRKNAFAYENTMSAKQRICYYNRDGNMIAVSHKRNVVLSKSTTRVAPSGW
jgi:hypothetical protein